VIEQIRIPCPKCGESTVRNANFCHTCGYPLKATVLSHARLTLTTDAIKVVETADLKREPTPFPKNGQVVLKFGDRELSLSTARRFILGRKSDASASSLVDLTPYGGWENGVSRDHAAMNLSADSFLRITDLASANGTFINGKRLRALQPYPLRDGDEIRLAELVMTVHFRAPEVTEPAPLTKVKTASSTALTEPLTKAMSATAKAGEVAAQK
jgi:hypothetical protein